MAHPLQAAAEAAMRAEAAMKQELDEAEKELDAALKRESILFGRVEALEKELTESKERRDHLSMAIGEISKQLNNVGMIVYDAMQVARTEVQKVKGNGPNLDQKALQAVDKALEGMKEEERPLPPIPKPIYERGQK